MLKRSVCGMLMLGVAFLAGGSVTMAQGAQPKESDMAKPSNLSKLVLEADGGERDSFSLVMQAVARYFGRSADYETVYALSANAFAPCVVLAEGECRGGRWLARGREQGLDLVARALGLTVTPVKLPGFKGDGRVQADLDAYMKVVAPVLRQHIDTGEVLVTTGGIAGNGHEYTWWAVIVDSQADGTIIASGINGRQDNQMAWPEAFWAISKGNDALGAKQADALVFRRALKRIRGDQVAPESFAGEKLITGLDAIDSWENAMAHVPYCLSCEVMTPAVMAGDLAEAATSVSHGATVASRYLRKRLPTFPEASRSHVEAAAEHYDRIVEQLRLFKDREACARIMGDAQKQKALATKVLKTVKKEFAGAAAEMEKALMSMGQEIPEEDR